MKKFRNKKKDGFLSSIPILSLDLPGDVITKRCKFNFHYMDFSQPAGQKFEEWTKDQLTKLLNKLKNYCAQPLSYWRTQPQRVGKKSHNVLEIYGNFPRKSEFVYPQHIPNEVWWARFRVENLARLVGFVIPNEYDGKTHDGTKMKFDCNTFYVVYLDRNHKFYIT